MSADLRPLELAAARVGLPGLIARVVPHDRRRGWWFRWGDGELLVSERVIDRCAPADACALLIDEVLRQRGIRRERRRIALINWACVALLFLAGMHDMWVMTLSARDSDRPDRVVHGDSIQDDSWVTSDWLLPPLVAGVVVVSLGGLLVMAWLAHSPGQSHAADDATVALLGDATPLVRGLNEMDFEEIHLAGKVLSARPDLHSRAERLVRLHRLCKAQPPA